MSRGPVIPAFGRQTQENGSKLEASLSYRSFQASQGFTLRSYVKTMRRGREGGGRLEGRRLRWGVCVRNPGQHEVCSETLKNKNTGCGVGSEPKEQSLGPHNPDKSHASVAAHL